MPEELAPRIVLSLSRRRLVGLWFGSLLLLAAAIYMLLHPDPSYYGVLPRVAAIHRAVGAVGIAFFGLGILVIPIALLPRAAYLELTEEGFVRRMACVTCAYRWTGVSRFEVVRYFGRDRVFFDVLAPEKARHGRLFLLALKLNRTVGRFDQMIEPSLYDLNAAELASLMNSFRDRALAQKSDTLCGGAPAD